MIKAENLCYDFGQHTLIKSVNLDLVAGQLTVLIGPNGAGKTTLLRLLTGYLQPSSGQCALNGRNLEQWSSSALAKVRAVMQQHTQLSFPFTVREVVTMGAAPYRHFDQKQLDQIMQQTDCDSLQHKDYRYLSGGEQQRVQLARALVQLGMTSDEDRWLFLDEPTSALDLYHQQSTLRLVKQLTKDNHLGVCCILHDLNLAALYADNILLLSGGQLVKQGTPQAVLTRECLTRWYGADLITVQHPHYALPQIHLLP